MQPCTRTSLAAAAMLWLGAPASVRAAGVFTLTAPAFADNGLLDRSNAGNDKANPNCTGANVSPALQWSNPPAATRSFALLLFDPQGRNGLGVSHQVAYGIAAAAAGFKQGALEAADGFVGGKGSAGRTVYYGPCPGPGSGLHHYVFTLIATDLEPGALEPGLTAQQLSDKLAGHAIGATSLVGRFGQ